MNYLARMSAVIAALIAMSSVVVAQTDTTHKMPPGMKMPMPETKPAPSPTKKPAEAPAKKPARTPAKKPPARAQAKPTMPDSMRMREMQPTQHSQEMDMNAMLLGPLGISMERMGSGTTWIPDNLRLPSRHFMLGSWGVMLHGFVFGQYINQSGPRGDDQLGSLNWAMVMADRPLAGGRLQFRFMPSIDAATVGRCGYPLLLQSGELCHGEPLVDRQHPHDFFMELGVLYERELTSRLAWFVYAAPAGEPALGPVAFMHRPSAMDNALAPLGHHWQDATHISFGVLTGGLYTRKVRIEASAFNGIEPDDNRWNFDPIKINSYSGRLTVNPDSSFSLTAGYGSLPDDDDPDATLHRVVASAMYGKRLGDDGQWATTLVYGANKKHEWTQSALAESEVVLDRHNTVFGRAEWAQKSAEDLVIPEFSADRAFNVGALSLGYIREVARGRDVTFGIGGSGTINFVPDALASAYGSNRPTGLMIFLRLRPYHSEHTKSDMHGAIH